MGLRSSFSSYQVRQDLLLEAIQRSCIGKLEKNFDD